MTSIQALPEYSNVTHVPAARAFVVADFSVGVSDTDIVIADLALSLQADVTINDFILSVPNV